MLYSSAAVHDAIMDSALTESISNGCTLYCFQMNAIHTDGDPESCVPMLKIEITADLAP